MLPQGCGAVEAGRPCQRHRVVSQGRAQQRVCCGVLAHICGQRSPGAVVLPMDHMSRARLRRRG
eukprot:11216551-Lingulodinium_polyedra.AAC.1